MRYRDVLFSCLPRTKCHDRKYGEVSLIQLLTRNIEKYSGDDTYELSVIMAKIIVERLQGLDPQTKWSLRDYGIFRTATGLIGDENSKIGTSALLTCLLSTDEVILEDLEFIAQNVDIYPGAERVMDPVTKKYQAIDNPIAVMDCYKLIKTLYSLMCGHVSRTTKALLGSGEDVGITCECVIDMIKRDGKQTCERYLQSFTDDFGFLERSFLYNSIYECFKANYFVYLLAELNQICVQNGVREMKKRPVFKNAMARKERKKEKKREYGRRRYYIDAGREDEI